jgi:hypothetical protein
MVDYWDLFQITGTVITGTVITAIIIIMTHHESANGKQK